MKACSQFAVGISVLSCLLCLGSRVFANTTETQTIAHDKHRQAPIVITDDDITTMQAQSAREKLLEINLLSLHLWGVYREYPDEAIYAEQYEELTRLLTIASYDKKNFADIILPNMHLLPPVPSGKARSALARLRKEEADRQAALALQRQRVEVERLYRKLDRPGTRNTNPAATGAATQPKNYNVAEPADARGIATSISLYTSVLLDRLTVEEVRRDDSVCVDSGVREGCPKGSREDKGN
jgi:hypothetical protein